MAVVPADLTYPPGGTGELHPEWYADGALPGLLAVWIVAGEGQAPVGATSEQGDRITLAYAYWLAYADLVLTMAAKPNSVSVDKGDISVAWTDGQRKVIAERVAFWLGEFNAALAEATAPAAVEYAPPRTSFSQPIVRMF